MSYANGRVYVDTSVTPNVGVSIYDVQRALGTTKNDDGELCTHTNINKWAKYKPLKYSKIYELNSTDMLSVNYGIKDIPTWTRLDYMSTFLFSTSRASLSQTYWPECDRDRTPSASLASEYWAYERPTGGSASPYRLTDFNNYYHFAVAPVENMESPFINISPEGLLQISFPKGPVDNPYTLLLEDLTYPGTMNQSISNMYFGVLMKKTSGGATYASLMMSGSNYVKIGDVSSARYFVVGIQLTASQASFIGTWNIYPIISKNTFPQLTTDLSTYNSGKFIAPLPYHGMDIEVSIEYAEVRILNALGYRDMSSQQRYVRVTSNLANDGSETRNYRITVQLYDRSQNPLSNYTGSSTGSLAAGASTTNTISIYVASDWRTLEGGYYTVKSEIDVNYDNSVFKRDNYWPKTQLQDLTPTPD